MTNDPIANQEEVQKFKTEQIQLKRLSDDDEHLVRKRDEKEAELKNLKSKGDKQSDHIQTSLVNPAYEDEEGEQILLLTVGEENADDQAKELEAEIREIDTAIANQDAKVITH